MSSKIFGTLLIIDADCCEGNITSKDHIQEFINKLVEDMGMKKVGETIFQYFEDNDYNRERDIVGYSVVQIISLSNITIHINELSRTIYLDVFTCSSLDEKRVIDIFREYFKPKTIKTIELNRDAIDLNLPFVKNWKRIWE